MQFQKLHSSLCHETMSTAHCIVNNPVLYGDGIIIESSSIPQRDKKFHKLEA